VRLPLHGGAEPAATRRPWHRRGRGPRGQLDHPIPGWSPSAGTLVPGDEVLNGCDGNTGGRGWFTFSTTQPQIITWANGQTTELGRAKVTTTENDPDTRGTCGGPSTPSTEYDIRGVVEADTTGSAPALGKYTYEVCGYPPTDAVVNEPGSKVKVG
jgi:hypothetical protein